MSLAQFVSSYLMAWEGNGSLQGDAWIALTDVMKRADVEEINTQMNVLTTRRLWNTELLSIFYDELRNRMIDDTTFVFSITDSRVEVTIGFESSYLLPDDGSTVISSDAFPEEERSRLLFMLIDGGVTAIFEDGSLVGLSSEKDDIELPEGLSSPIVSGDEPVSIQEMPDFTFMKRLLTAVRGDPEVIDMHASGLINQLIDYEEALDNANDEGFTFEGDLYLDPSER